MIHQVEEIAANYDLSISRVVLHKEVSTTSFYQVRLKVGSDAKPCVTLAGVWKMRLMLTVAGDTFAASVEPREQEIYASSAAHKEFVSAPISLNATDTIEVGLQSPNVGDECVGVTAWLFDLNYALPDAAAAAENGLPVLDANSLVNVDVERLAGAAQSLTDLKDFADTGYNPTTHKVAGVVLVDTTTTNTDMVAAAPSTADIVTAMQAAGTMLKALDDLTKAAGDGDLAAMKTIIDALPDAGALTTLQAAVDALVAGAPINIDNKGIVITNEDITP